MSRLPIRIIATSAVSATVVEILTLKARKWLILLTAPLFDAPALGNPLEFLDETYTQKLKLSYGDKFMILS